jgi:DNA-directed RNA polymerase I, II, and III subunit RPABC2
MSDEEIDEDYEESEDTDEENESMSDHEVIDEFCIEEEPLDEKKDINKILKTPNYIQEVHPQEKMINYEEVLSRCTVTRDADKNIMDEYHTTVPILTKYEYTRILGVRASQIEHGAPLFIDVPETLIDSYLIAKDELYQKKLPFILKRPLPNGTIEYWKLEDLEILF